MRLTNIANEFNDIHLFLRDEEGNLKIESDKNFLYIPDGTTY